MDQLKTGIDSKTVFILRLNLETKSNNRYFN